MNHDLETENARLRVQLAEADRERNDLRNTTIQRALTTMQLLGQLERCRAVLAETPAQSLDAHDREVRRKVLEKAAEDAEGESYMDQHSMWAQWLRDLAAQEAQEGRK